MKHLREQVEKWLSVAIGEESWGKLEALADWLEDEAVPAGGVGPGDRERLVSIHIFGSLAYARGWDSPPAQCWDLGSGVGLPGLPLAVIWPQTEITLIDRSRKRIDLARRAARVCGIEVATQLAELDRLTGRVTAIVSRAALPASQLAPALRRLLLAGGRAVVSGGRQPAPPGFVELVVPKWEGSLDPSRRLLMMNVA